MYYYNDQSQQCDMFLWVGYDGVISFQWVQYYHYSCGGPCYSSVPFEVINLESGQLTLYYNNGSGPAPQAYSMFLTLGDWEPLLLGDVNNDGLINVVDVITIVNFILNNAEPTSTEFYISDMNEDGLINVVDIISFVNVISSYEILFIVLSLNLKVYLTSSPSSYVILSTLALSLPYFTSCLSLRSIFL